MVINKWMLYFLSILAYVLYVFLKPWVRSAILVLSLPGPPTTPLFGNWLQTKKGHGVMDFLKTAYTRYGSIVGTWLSVIPAALVVHPKHLQVILGSSKLTKKHFIYKLCDSVAGHGLITKNGEEWRSHRMYIQPYFNRNILKKHIPDFVKCSEIFVNNLKTSEEIRITTAIHSFLMNLLHKTILGIPIEDNETKTDSPFNKGQNPVLDRLLKPLFLINLFYKITSYGKNYQKKQESWLEFTAKVLEKLKEGIKTGSATGDSLLEYLLKISKSNDNFSEEDVVNEASAFMLAGNDTLRSTIAFTLYYLAKHQDIQDHVVDELNQLNFEPSAIDIKVLKEMKYLEQCIKEGMRLNPAVPLIGRTMCEDTKLDNYTVPKGCSVYISPYATHRIPELYPNPEEFDPDRFLEKTKDRELNFAFIPFSAGPRNCIAHKFAMLAIKTVVALVLKNYQIELAPGKEGLVPLYRLTLKTKDGIWLKFEHRETTNKVK